MTFTAKTLRPGLLVSLKTTLRGNIDYDKRNLESDVTADGAAVAKWETVRTIADIAEHERGTQARGRANSLIRSVCAKSAFGLLCREDNRDALSGAIAKARAVADQFNESAALSRLTINVMIGRVAADDVEAVKAINAEIRELLATMETGVRNLDVATIRDAATRAKDIGQMLTPDAAARVAVAIEAARKTATAINKAGDTAAQAVDSLCLKTLAEARTAFLDLDSDVESVAMPETESRALDLAPIDTESEYGPIIAPSAPQSAVLEL